MVSMASKVEINELRANVVVDILSSGRLLLEFGQQQTDEDGNSE